MQETKIRVLTTGGGRTRENGPEKEWFRSL